VKKLRKMLSRLFWSAGWKAIGPFVERLFFTALLIRTANFTKLRWLGTPIRQNVFDLWTIQETIAQLRPSLIIETGTNLGGSSLFFGQVFDLMGTTGRVVTIDTGRQHEINSQAHRGAGTGSVLRVRGARRNAGKPGSRPQSGRKLTI
jgi:cephalosporin hydroxylase